MALQLTVIQVYVLPISFRLNILKKGFVSFHSQLFPNNGGKRGTLSRRSLYIDGHGKRLLPEQVTEHSMDVET